jgi:hypothetical protein
VLRPAQEPLEVDYDPIVEWIEADREAWLRGPDRP